MNSGFSTAFGERLYANAQSRLPKEAAQYEAVTRGTAGSFKAFSSGGSISPVTGKVFDF